MKEKKKKLQCNMSTLTQKEKSDLYIQFKEDQNEIRLRQLISNLLNQVILLEGKKGKGKTIAGVGIIQALRDLFGRPVVIIGSKMGLTEEFGDFTYLDERKFIDELDKIASLSKSSSEDEVSSTVETALENLGINIMNATLVFDEAYKLFDARTPSDKLVRVFGYFVAQSRHYGITIILMSPNRDMIDKRVRRQIDWFGRCTTTCKTVPNPETAAPECVRFRCPHRTRVRFIGGIDRFKLNLYGPNYWPLFDTWAKIGFRESHLKGIKV